MSNQSSGSSSSTNIAGLLGVAFVILKLTGYITWSWWWVTLPFWGGLALVLALLFGGGIIVALGLGLKEIFKRK